MAHSSVKVNHALKLLSNLEEMRKKNTACDFEIRVNEKSFSVHRTVLIATCPYFESLFSSNMTEVQNGFIVMKEVTAEGVKCFIDFTYTGEVQITSSNIQCILEASHLLQLDDLVDICLQYLRDNMSAETSLLAVQLFDVYGTTADQATADQYVIQHFTQVIQTSTFPLISKQDLKRYLKTANLDPENHWKAITGWLGQNEKETVEDLPDLVGSLLETGKCCLRVLVGTVWKHILVQNNDHTKSLILEALSGKEETLEEDMDWDICYTLKSIIRTHKFSSRERINEILDKYLATNFNQVVQIKKFYNLAEEDMSTIFRSEHLNCQVATVKWETLMKWVKHEKSREKTLPNLMKLIDFDKMPVEYINKNVRNEPSVKKSKKCRGILQDALYYHASRSTLVMLDHGSNVLTALDFENGNNTEIMRVGKAKFMRVTSVRGELYLLKNKELHKYSSSGSWDKRASLPVAPPWHAQVATLRDDIYVVAEYAMLCYSPSENTWEKDLPGCELGWGFCVAASEDCIYALGGLRSTDKGRRYDLKAKRWFDIASMNYRRVDGSAAFVFREKLYVMGGNDFYSNYSSPGECYDRFYDTWTRMPNMNRIRDCFSAVVYNDKPYVVGGDRDEKGKKLDEDSIEVFEQDSNKWKIVQRLPKSEGTITACAVNSDILEPQVASNLLLDMIRHRQRRETKPTKLVA